EATPDTSCRLRRPPIAFPPKAEKHRIKPEPYGPMPCAREHGIFCGLAGNLNRQSGNPRTAPRRYFRRPIRSSREISMLQIARRACWRERPPLARVAALAMAARKIEQ